MAQWFYVDKNQQRIGPMDANVLVDALRHGQLNLNSMVWQEGMHAWKPLSMHFDALGVPESMRVRKKEKSGNAGVWVIVLVVGGFIGIAVLGILAAIAIPAYNDYTVRAKLSGAINAATPAKVENRVSFRSRHLPGMECDGQQDAPDQGKSRQD